MLFVVLTSEVSVEFLQPPDLVHQFSPQGLLQALPLTAALQQSLMGLGYPLDLLLQLNGQIEGRGERRKFLVSHLVCWFNIFICVGDAGGGGVGSGVEISLSQKLTYTLAKYI